MAKFPIFSKCLNDLVSGNPIDALVRPSPCSFTLSPRSELLVWSNVRTTADLVLLFVMSVGLPLKHLNAETE